MLGTMDFILNKDQKNELQYGRRHARLAAEQLTDVPQWVKRNKSLSLLILDYIEFQNLYKNKLNFNVKKRRKIIINITECHTTHPKNIKINCLYKST